MEEKVTLDETLVNRALADSWDVYYEVLEPHIQDATINDDGDWNQSLDVENQNEEFNSQESRSYSITPSGQEAAASLSQESDTSPSMSRVSQEVLADKRRMEEWEKEMKEMKEMKEEERMPEEERMAAEEVARDMEERERDYRALGFDVRLEEARFIEETKEQRSKVLKLVAEE